MTIWKKAISAVTSAALLASLLATAVAPGAFAATDNTDFLGVCTPASCSVVADGISRVKVAGEATGVVPAGSSLLLQISGATFSTAAADSVGFATTNSTTATKAGGALATDFVTVVAPAAVGTATISVFLVPAQGNATAAGTFTLDFYAAGSTAVSAANTTVTASKTTIKAAVADADSATVTVVVKDGVSPTPNTITSGITVNASIGPVGLVNGAQVAADAASPYVFTITGSGLANTASLTLSVTTNATGARVDLPPVALIFSGTTASVTATGVNTALVYTGANVVGAVTFVSKDAGGNKTSSAATLVTTGTVFTAAISQQASAAAAGKVDIDCNGTLGSGTVAVKDNGFTSNAITIYCSDAPDSFTVAFGATVVAAGGSTTLTVKVLDENGKPAPAVNANVVVSSGAISAPWKTTNNGEAVFTYLAPFNFGTATALVTVDTIDGSKSASINIGVPTVVTTLGSTASTLGVAPPGGSWSTSTKVAKVGEFITWRFAAGVANAGKTIGVFLQTKDANGVWSAPVRFSARVADSSGNAYFSWKGTSAMWVSIRGGLGDARSTPPVQGRWQ